MFPIRAVEDDHVDRPGVEAPQGVELTGTNSSIGLIALINAMLINSLTRLFGAKSAGRSGRATLAPARLRARAFSPTVQIAFARWA